MGRVGGEKDFRFMWLSGCACLCVCTHGSAPCCVGGGACCRRLPKEAKQLIFCVAPRSHLKITFPDDILVRTQYWDAVTLLGEGPTVEWPKTGPDLQQHTPEQSLQEQLLSNPNAHLLVPVNLTGATDAGVPTIMPELHTYADGDFFLATRAAVDQVRGYPEIPLPVLVDSYLTVATSAAGYRQHLFMPPACVFHQFHPQGTMPQRVAQTVGQPEIDAFVRNVTWMLSNRQPIIVNDGNWGYSDHTFEEETFVAEGKVR